MADKSIYIPPLNPIIDAVLTRPTLSPDGRKLLILPHVQYYSEVTVNLSSIVEEVASFNKTHRYSGNGELLGKLPSNQQRELIKKYNIRTLRWWRSYKKGTAPGFV